jgi:hypothetical protein
MRYEIQFMALGFLGHVAVGLEMPGLREQPVPVRVAVAALPSALLLVQGLLLNRWLSNRASDRLSLATGLLYGVWSVALPVSLVVGAALGRQSWDTAVVSALGWLVLQVPALLVTLLIVPASLENLREQPAPSPPPS